MPAASSPLGLMESMPAILLTRQPLRMSFLALEATF
jgi:hypothetical protein